MGNPIQSEKVKIHFLIAQFVELFGFSVNTRGKHKWHDEGSHM